MKAAVLFACVMIPLMLVGVWRVEAQEVSFHIYTDKGTYRVGETININIYVSFTATITITLNGPYTVNIEPFELEPGLHYITLGPAEERHIGRWEVIGQACPVTTPTPTPTPTPSPTPYSIPTCAQDKTVFFVEAEEVKASTETITQTVTTTETRCPGLATVTQYMTQYVSTTTTLTKEVVPGFYYLFTVIFVAAAAGL